MKAIRKVTLCVLSFVIMFMMMTATFDKKDVSAAETARISVSSGSCEVGDTVTITITVSGSNIMLCDFYVNYDASIITAQSGYDAGGNGTIRIVSTESTTFKVTFKAVKPGTSTISVARSTAQIGSETEDSMNVAASSGSVSVSAPASYSSDDTLSSLEISPGVLSPAFSPSVTTYTTSVGSDCDKLTVSAIANDSKATVKVSGTRMDPGLNTTTITVTAEDGSKRTYTIKTTKGDDVKTPDDTTKATDSGQPDNSQSGTDGPDTSAIQEPNVDVGGREYKIISSFDEYPLPDGYVQADSDYNGVKIAVGMGTNTDLLLVYLESVDGTGESGFYVYDSVNQSFSKYIEVSQPELSYCILPIDAASMELPDGYELGKIDIDGREVEVLLDKTGNYALFYGVSSTGGTGWFRYNTNDGTIQGYAGYNTADEPVFNIIDRKNNSSTGSFSLFKGINLIFMIIIAALAIVIIILAVMVEMLSRKLKVSKKAFVKAMDDYDDSDEYDSTDYAEDNNADYEDNSYSADENDLSDKNYDADAEDILNNSGISDTEDTSSENVSEEIELEEIELEDKNR